MGEICARLPRNWRENGTEISKLIVKINDLHFMATPISR